MESQFLLQKLNLIRHSFVKSWKVTYKADADCSLVLIVSSTASTNISRIRSMNVRTRMADSVFKCLFHADDAVLIASTISMLQTLGTVIQDDCMQEELQLNTKKINIMVFEGELLGSRRLSRKARLVIHNAMLNPTVLYQSESSLCRKKHESKINAIDICMFCSANTAEHLRS